MPKIYSTLDDYITQQVAPALAELNTTATRDQLREIAHQMTIWHDEYTPAGEINLNRSGYVKNTTRDFWTVVFDALFPDRPAPEN